MIVIGYQGIGKSTLVGKNHKYIDLESSNFWVDGKREIDWYKPYCQIAEHLSQQGYIVFTSSHEVVRRRLRNSSESIVVVVPSRELKDEWIKKLQVRYDQSGLEKDYKALMNAKERYEDNVNEMYLDGFFHFSVLEIKSIDYDLEQMLEEEMSDERED